MEIKNYGAKAFLKARLEARRPQPFTPLAAIILPHAPALMGVSSLDLDRRVTGDPFSGGSDG